MTISVSEFRCEFPEFESEVLYPAPMLAFWAEFVQSTLVFSDIPVGVVNMAHKFAIAHYATKAASRQAQASGGGIAGQSSGAVASKSVGGASVSYDLMAASFSGVGDWSTTEYGRAYLTIIRPYSVGILQV